MSSKNTLVDVLKFPCILTCTFIYRLPFRPGVDTVWNLLAEMNIEPDDELTYMVRCG